MSTPEKIHGDSNVFRVLDRIGTAIEMYRDGHTWEDIANTVGYASRGAAHKAVTEYMRQNVAETANDLRSIEGRRLDADELRLRQIIATSDDPTHVMRAIDTRIRLSARRARLFGLDAPVQVALSAGVAADLADALAEAEATLLGSTVRGEVTASSDQQLDEP